MFESCLFPVALIGRDGAVRLIGTPEEFLVLSRQVLDEIGPCFDEHLGKLGNIDSKAWGYILRDDAGAVVLRQDVHAYIMVVRQKSVRRRRYLYGETVSHVGRSRWRFRNYYRAPACHGRMKALSEDAITSKEALLAYGVHIRGRLASKAAIITSWDDQPRSDRDDRTWKRHRRTQWRGASSDTAVLSI